MADREIDVVARKARAAIEADRVDELRRLLADHPALLGWRDPADDFVVLLQATTSYANFPGAEHEGVWNRPACAEALLDAGAVVDPRVVLRIIDTGAHGMLALFERKNALPRNLRVTAALGDLDGLRDSFDATGRLRRHARPDPVLRAAYPRARADWPPDDEQLIVPDAFLYACRLGHRPCAALLLERCTALDPALGARIDGWEGSDAFVDYLIRRVPEGARFALSDELAVPEPSVIWQRAVELRLHEALQAGNADEVTALLAAEDHFLGTECVPAQAKLLEVAAYAENALPVIDAILESGAAIVEASPPPESPAISYALEYGHADYVPSLSRVWEVRDDLPHAAAMGDRERVSKWFNADGQPQLCDPARHNPFPDHVPTVSTQDILDRALAWAVRNDEYAIADLLIDRGADIDTRWSTHEPASILHECAFAGRMDQVEYLVAKGIDLTIRDHRFDATAEGWARFAEHEEIADYLARQAARPDAGA